MTDPSREHLKKMYRHRFDDDDRLRIGTFWDLFFQEFLKGYVPRDGTVLDLAAGSCDFINRASAARRIAVDLNPDLERFADEGVETYACRSDDLAPIGSETVDLVFTSNFFEHLSSPEELMETLTECHRILRTGGTILVLMPNLRAVGAKYYDYLDHKLPVTDRSLVEALGLVGFSLNPPLAVRRGNAEMPFCLEKMGVLDTSRSQGEGHLLDATVTHTGGIVSVV